MKSPENQDANVPATIEALRNCGLLKYFWIPRMKAHVQLLEYIIDTWDPDQENFLVGVHILPIEIKGIYFFTGLSMRGSPVVLSGAQAGEGPLDDIIDQHFSLSTEDQSGKLQIKCLVDLPLRIVVYTIGKVAGTRDSHLTSRSHMLYALQCMEPTVFNWSEGILACLKNQLNK